MSLIRKNRDIIIPLVFFLLYLVVEYLIVDLLKGLEFSSFINFLLVVISYQIKISVPVFVFLSIFIVFFLYKIYRKWKIKKPNILFKDNFRDLQKWNCENNNIKIQNSHLLVTGAGRGCVTKTGASWQNLKLKFKTIIYNHNFSFVVRARDLDNYVMIQCTLNKIRPHHRQNGRWSLLSTASAGINLIINKEYNIEVEVIDDSLKLFIDGSEVFYNDSILSGFDRGKMGFRESGNEKAEFYDLKVEEL